MTQDDAPKKEESSAPVEEGGDSYHSRILIKPGGEVVIENLSIDLLELVEMLDPDSPVACQIPGLGPAPDEAADASGEEKDQSEQ